MAVNKVHIDRDQYEFRSSENENIAIIYLYDDEDRLQAMIAFVDGQAPLPGPRLSPSGVVSLTWRKADLAAIIDMLRNESPVFFTWSIDAQTARITTEEDPMGDEEYKSFWKLLFS